MYGFEYSALGYEVVSGHPGNDIEWNFGQVRKWRPSIMK